MKIWQKHNSTVAAKVEAFTVGKDPEFDLALAPFDIMGSLAHTEMLCETGLLTPAEKESVHKELQAIMQMCNNGTFAIEPGVEDVHSQVELMLTRAIGDTGKKIHSGRSRNDQVAVDIKLYLRHELETIQQLALKLFDVLLELSDQHQHKLLPGYTHLQLGMPSSFGLWFAAYAESLVDDMELWTTAFQITNKNPLGSGAGYGSSFPLDRKLTTRLLQFSDLHYNAVYAQMSRGKTERFVAMAISGFAATMSRMAMDICLYMNQNFGFISFPAELTTGSSIMPHKKNPDIFELVRGKCNRLQALPNELSLLTVNLPSGYHRELQLTKEILFPAIEVLKDCFDIMCFALPQMQVKDDILKDDKYSYLFTVEAVNGLVNEGMTFRDAYRKIGEAVEQGIFEAPPFDIKTHTHEGSMGNLCNDDIKKAMQKVTDRSAVCNG